VDFVFLVDTSASMRMDSKLAFVQATMEYLLSRLSEKQTISMLAFNHEVRSLCKMLPCTPENIKIILDQIKSLQAFGSTNISQAIKAGTSLLASRSTQTKRISSLMLFTDGLSNEGLAADSTLSSLSDISFPTACTFNTFGLGMDHDSSLLQSIALKAQGVYYYVETKEEIPSTFGECVAAILSTRAHHINVQLRGRDGARIVTIATPFRIVERKVAKDYDVDLELMYAGESKSIIFRTSVRAVPTPTCHSVMDVHIEYCNTLTEAMETIDQVVSLMRPSTYLVQPSRPISLDEQILRYMTASVIQEAVSLAQDTKFTEAQEKLVSSIHQIEKSPSGSEPYCIDLIKDLNDCIEGMRDVVSFQKGIHTAHAYSSMYFMERSTGLGLKKHLETCRSSLRASQGKLRRHLGYGYSTKIQDHEARNANDFAARKFIPTN